MITLNDIRIEIADRAEEVRDIMLSDSQARVLLVIRQRESVTARWIAKRYDISIQSASSVLHRLYQKGYLCRRQEPQESGGYEYEYSWQLD